MSLDTPTAQQVEAALLAEWKVLGSYLEDFLDGEGWRALGYDSVAEWLADRWPDRTLPGLGPTAPVPSGPGSSPARVSRPGKRESTRATPGRYREPIFYR